MTEARAPSAQFPTTQTFDENDEAFQRKPWNCCFCEKEISERGFCECMADEMYLDSDEMGADLKAKCYKFLTEIVTFLAQIGVPLVDNSSRLHPVELARYENETLHRLGFYKAYIQMSDYGTGRAVEYFEFIPDVGFRVRLVDHFRRFHQVSADTPAPGAALVEEPLTVRVFRTRQWVCGGCADAFTVEIIKEFLNWRSLAFALSQKMITVNWMYFGPR